MKQGVHFWVIDPFCWLFYCFFQPTRFKREYEREGIIKRIIPMLRLILPLFLLSYLLALILELFFFLVTHRTTVLQVDVALLSLGTFLAVSAKFVLLGVIIGCIVGIGGGIALGSALAIALGVAEG